MKNKYYEFKVLSADLPLKSEKKDDIIQWIYDIHIVEWYTTYLLKKSMEDEDVQDKIQEIYLMICEVPQKRWNELYSQGRFAVSGYVTGIIHQQLISKTSKIYKKYGKYNDTFQTKDDVFWTTYDEENKI